jgi:uncharacterized paraquat-inducible protein A
MTLTQFDYCERCDDRVELVPVAGSEALACCRCGSITGDGL